VKRLAVLVAVSVLIWGATPRRSEASAFVINVLTSSSSGGHSGGGAAGGIPGGGGSGSGGGLAPLKLGGPAIGGAIGKSTLKPSSPQDVGQLVSEAQSAAPTGPLGAVFPAGQIAGTSGPAPGAVHLNLGNDDYLTVSGAVGQSLANNLYQSDANSNQVDGHSVGVWTDPAGGGANGTGTSGGDTGGSNAGSPASGNTGADSGNGGPKDVINAVLPGVATGIVLSIDDTSGLLPGSQSNAITPVEATPEPGSLLLFGSGLAFVAYWMRGRKSPATKR